MAIGLKEDYETYVEKFSIVWKYLQSKSLDLDTTVTELCKLRRYYGSEAKWKKFFEETGLVYIAEDRVSEMEPLKADTFKDMALFSKKGNFLLTGRYAVPVKDMLGNIIALIGWYPDDRKYITTPSKYFNRKCLFLGMEQLSKTGFGKNYIITEGVFDSFSLRAIGLNAVAQMGIADSDVKKINYGMFGRVLATPDGDKQGQKVLENDKWHLPVNGSYLKWTNKIGEGEDAIYLKDMDDFCNIFEDNDVVALIEDCFKQKKRIVKIGI